MKLVLLAVLLWPTMGYSQTTYELQRQTYEKLQDADGELNRIYSQIIEKYGSDTVFISKLKEAQREWIKSRDADMAMIFPYKDIDPQLNYGSSFSMCYLANLMVLTEERTKFLKQWIDAEYTYGCSGSIGRWRTK